MEIKNLKPNTKVKLHTKTGDFECVILESPNPEIILVKLNSGYNIGIREEDILDAKILKSEKAKPVKNKKKKKEGISIKNYPLKLIIASVKSPLLFSKAFLESSSEAPVFSITMLTSSLVIASSSSDTSPVI